MGIRKWINDHQQVSGAIAVAAATLAVVTWVYWDHGVDIHPPERAWYWDLKTHELFVAANTYQPPITAPSGARNGVKAIVFSCDGCKSRYVGWLETTSEALQNTLNEEARPSSEFAAENYLFAAEPPDMDIPPQWVSSKSLKASQLIDAAQSRCEKSSRPARVCHP